MRAIKMLGVAVLLAAILLAATLAWLVRSEQGSRWFVEQGSRLAPGSIVVSGITGTLADGLNIATLDIALPVAQLRAENIVVRWRPASLLNGVVAIRSLQIAGLSVDVPASKGAAEPSVDRLFWLQLPVYIHVKSGQIERLRINAAEFAKLSVSGTIGHGELNIASLSGESVGAVMQLSGNLTGPAPGQLQASVSWDWPVAKLSGAGSFNGNIEKLAVRHLLNMPDEVHFNGSLYDLFSAPALHGVATWSEVRLPVTAELRSKSGEVAISSDFRSASLDGDATVLLAGWPEMPVQLQGTADLQGISIAAGTVAVAGGLLTGSGRIEYSDGLSGHLELNGSEIDPRIFNENIPGELKFAAAVLFESAENFRVDVSAANALIAGKNYSGQGNAHWQEGALAMVDTTIVAGANRVTANINLGQQLAGKVKADLPDLAMLWPGLQGSMDASVTLAGSLEKPQFAFNGTAAALQYGAQSLRQLAVSGSLQSGNKLTGKLAVTGLATGQQQLGDLDLTLAGTLAEHQARLKLAGAIVSVELHTTGGWDGELLTQRFHYGRVQPDGFDAWQLEQNAELRVSRHGGQLDAHCWKQVAAAICLEPGNWNAESLQFGAAVDDFALATLKPLLADGYSIAGSVDASMKVMRDSSGVRGKLHWQQSRTQLRYADEFDEFQTVLNEVRIDLTADAAGTELTASISGEEGLTLTATAGIRGLPEPASPLQAAINGQLPSIGLLRPLLQRVVNPGELQGSLRVDLDVGGTLGNPVFSGGAYLADGVLGLTGAGATLTDINIALTSKASDQLQVTGELRSGEGRAQIHGNIFATAGTQGKSAFAAEINIQGENLASVRTPELSVDTSPDLKLRISEDQFDISGTINIPHARAQIRDLPVNAVARSEDVIVHGPERAVTEQGETIVTGEIEVLLGDDVRYKGFGLDARLEGSLKLTQSRGGFLRGNGTVRVRDGFLLGYGKELRVDRGVLTFTGDLEDPLINIQVSRESFYEGRQYTVGLRLTGSALNVKTEPFSRPAMSDNDVLSFLLIDQPTGTGASASSAAVALGLGKLVPGDGGLLGLDEVGFETNDANQAAMVAGKRINDKLYVRYVFGSLGEPGAFRIRYRLGRGFSLEASTGTGSRQSLDIIYLLER